MGIKDYFEGDKFFEEREMASLILALGLITDDCTVTRYQLPKVNNTSIYVVNYKDLEIILNMSKVNSYRKPLQKLVSRLYKEHFDRSPMIHNEKLLLMAINKIVNNFRHYFNYEFNPLKDFKLKEISSRIDNFNFNYLSANRANEESSIVSTAVIVADHFKDFSVDVDEDSILDHLEEGMAIEEYQLSDTLNALGDYSWLQTPKRDNNKINIEAELNYSKLITFAYAFKFMRPQLNNQINFDNVLALSYGADNHNKIKSYYLHDRQSMLEDSKQYLTNLYMDIIACNPEISKNVNIDGPTLENLALKTIEDNISINGLNSLIKNHITNCFNNHNYNMDNRLVGTAILTLQALIHNPRMGIHNLNKYLKMNHELSIDHPNIEFSFIKEYLDTLSKQLNDTKLTPEGYPDVDYPDIDEFGNPNYGDED